MQNLADSSMAVAPWERLPGEKTLWYGRFLLYLFLLWRRSVYGACIREWEILNAGKEEKEKSKKTTGTPGAWLRAAQEWDWEGRALAWDTDRRVQVEKSLQETWDFLSLAGPKASETLVSLLSSTDDEQKRLAATSVLQRLFTLYGRGEGDEKPKEIQFVEFA